MPELIVHLSMFLKNHNVNSSFTGLFVLAQAIQGGSAPCRRGCIILISKQEVPAIQLGSRAVTVTPQRPAEHFINVTTKKSLNDVEPVVICLWKSQQL